MPIASVRLTPGQNVEETPTYNSAGIFEVEFGRFKAGLFQKLGGWTKYYPFAVDGDGKCLHAWEDINSDKHLAIGTTTELDVITDGILVEITPQELISDFSPDFTSTSGDATIEIIDPNLTADLTTDDSVEFLTPVSIGGLILSGIYRVSTITASGYTIEARADATASESNAGTVPEFDTTLDSVLVSVTLADHGQAVGNSVVFAIPTTGGGVTIEGRYPVISVTTADVFTINASSPATSTATFSMNGGDAELRYYIALGASGAGLGYGLGTYGSGLYGLGGGSGSVQTGDPIEAEDWTLDNWGDLLLACPKDRGLFFWGPNSGFTNASLVVEAPAYNRGMFISQSKQQVIAYGSSINAWDPATQASGVGGIGIYRDPLLIRWCDFSNFFDWEPTSENAAGSDRLSTGSLIVGSTATKNRNLFWTDLDLWAHTFAGQPIIYTPNKIGSNCGLIAQHAFASLADADYWMGKNNFFVYAGSGVQPIPCSVWDEVFQDIDRTNEHKCVAGSNTDFTEVWWYFPTASGGLGYPDKWAKYNTVEGTWDTGPLDRLFWIDRSVLGNPIAINASGVIFSHESGFDNDGDPMLTSLMSGAFFIEEGMECVTVDQMIPDFKWGTFGGAEDAQIFITLYYVDTPGETPKVSGPYLVTKATQFVTLDPAIRARQIQVKVSSSDTGSFWRMGLLRFRWAPAGRVIGVVP